DCRRWASLDAQVAESTELEMIHELVNRFFLFTVRLYIKLGNDLDRSVGASQLTSRAPGAGMFIILIVRHYYFPTKSFRQFQLIFIIRVLLGNDFFMMKKIITRPAHALQQ